MSKLFLIIITFSLSLNVFSQNDCIDTFIESQMALRKIPGLQVAIVKNNEITLRLNPDNTNAQKQVEKLKERLKN